MRIGIITGEYPPLQGGVGAYTDILAKRLQSLGHEIFIFSERRATQQSEAIPLKRYEKAWDFGAIRAIQAWIKENRLEIISLQFQTAAYQMSPWIHFLPHFLPIPVVTTFHDLRFPYLFPKAGFLRDWIVMHLARNSSGAIVTNHEDFERVKELPESVLIPMGSTVLAEASSFEKDIWREKSGAKADNFLIAHFGFINHSKGVDTLLKALAKLDKPHIHLLMIGDKTGTADASNAAYAQTIDNLIKELGLESQITWTGFVSNEDVFAYLQAADAVVLPFRDGASFRRSSLMVAIHLACPIITTQPNISISEFEQGQMLLVPADNAEELAHTIQKLQSSPELRFSLQEKVKTLRQRFDWDIVAEDTARFFRQVLEAAL